MKVLKGLPPPRTDNETNLFLHAGAGEDTTLLLQTGGDQFGHGSRVGCVFHLWGNKTRKAYSINTHLEKKYIFKKRPRHVNVLGVGLSDVSWLGGNTFDRFHHMSSQSGEVFYGKCTGCGKGMRLGQILETNEGIMCPNKSKHKCESGPVLPKLQGRILGVHMDTFQK